VEARHWKPALRWVIDRIHVLNPIRFENIRRNEVASVLSSSNVKKAMKTGNLSDLVYYVDDGDNRQQRAAVILKNVCYVIEAHFELTEHAEASDNEGKHIDMTRRRARDGQCFYQPYLGTREFTANFELIEDRTAIPKCHEQLNGEKDLGWMLWDMDFKNGMTPHFFRANMTNGIITVPTPSEMLS
jgi:CRISPR-associated protein Cas5d